MAPVRKPGYIRRVGAFRVAPQFRRSTAAQGASVRRRSFNLGSILFGAWLFALCGGLTPAYAQQQSLVEFGSTAKYLANSSNPGLGETWTSGGFDDSGWSVGTYGIGYEDGTGAENLIRTSLPSGTMSIYTRATFDIDDVTAITGLFLGADHDDGYVAWINGVEVYRSTEMSPTGPLDWNTVPVLQGEPSNGALPEYAPIQDLTTSGIPLLQNGTNVLAVGVWNISEFSSDLLVAPSLTYTTILSRGPYLQQGSDSEITVRWRTETADDSIVEYGTELGNLTQFVDDPASATEHELKLTNLLPDTLYYYSVGSTSGRLAGDDEDHFFVTAPTTGDSKQTRAWLLGDSGTANADARAVRDAYYAFEPSRHTDLWMMLGDNAYETGTDAEYQAALFDMFPEMARKSVLWPTLGNHDAGVANTTTGLGGYYDFFTLPTNAEAGGVVSGTESYYSYDYGSIHFVVLNSHDEIAVDMQNWLISDLATTTQEWIVAYWHHSAYSKGNHDSDVEPQLVAMRTLFVPILDDYGADLVFSGHSHSYERSWLIDGFYATPTVVPGDGTVIDGGDGRESGDGPYLKPLRGPVPIFGVGDGIVHTVAGSSGKITGGLLNHPVMETSHNVLGSVILDIYSSRADVRFLSSTGTVLDDFTMIKDCASSDSDSDGICFELDNCPDDPNGDQTDTDDDGLGDACDTCNSDPVNDVDSDGVCGDVDNCPNDANSGQLDGDSDGVGDACDTCLVDPDNDVDGDGVCGDVDNCPDTANAGQGNLDGDTFGDACDPCPNDFNIIPIVDFDGDGIPDNCDPDDDDDDIADEFDVDPLDPFACRDQDGDGCDDCSSGWDDPSNDGPDYDSDGQCNVGDTDDDNDGIADGSDTDPLDPNACRDVDADTCDDCSSGIDDPANDGTDTDSDGLCDAGDPDDDNDGVDDGSDVAPLDPNACRDVDADTCDDCSSGDDNPANDGLDTDSDGLCDPGDSDDDNDGVDDGADSAPLNPNVCRDVDSDTCDDCTSGSDNPGSDGLDTDSDGLCDAGDADDDNDGVDDGADSAPLNPNVCRDADGDSCDDCAGGSDNPADDGLDFDSDGLCDAGDADDDNDGVDDGSDSAPLNPNVCRDADADGCEDCSSGTSDPANDGLDTDSDGICDLTDGDDDGDGVADGADSDPLDGSVCRDLDDDTCDDCAGGSLAILIAGFNGGTNVFAYSDDTFRGTSEPTYADGVRDSVGGLTGGALTVTLGGVDGQGISNMSGGWDRSFSLSVARQVTISFQYKLTQSNSYEPPEYSQILLSVDGVLFGSAPNDYIDQVTGDGNGGAEITTGWQSVSVDVGVLSSGAHTLTIGGFNSHKSNANEVTDVRFDDVIIFEVEPSGTADPAHDGPDQDGDAICDPGDNCPTSSNGGQADFDDDGLGNPCDSDDDNDGVNDGPDTHQFNPNLCGDSDGDGCEDCISGSSDPANDGLDTDSDGLCDSGDSDDDGDGVDDGSDSAPLDPNVCRDLDADGCDDCTSGTDDVANDGLDTDSDGDCNAGDDDDDNDGVNDGPDSAPLDPNVCRDADGDTCDDCTSGTDDVANDGLDTDSDGDCNAGDDDDDNDGVNDGSDSAPLDSNVCRDLDADGCDDCANGSDDPSNDGLDTDGDGACNVGDPDDDNDGVDDGGDIAPLDPNSCRDADGDTCDDCTGGSDNPADDGLDTEGDGLCDAGDPDDDNDGVEDGSDSAPLNPNVCRDLDGDTCDDCSSGTDNPANDGLDTEGDGLCDAGDDDDDNDGVEDGLDSAPLNPNVCRDADADTCDDCSSGTDNTANDGLDTEGDGLCDAGDPDDDNDGVNDGQDNAPFDPNVCRDLDADSCDDCTNGSDDPSNDGLDTDSDGACDAGDPDDDNDGVADGLDSAPLDPNVCRDADGDTCDDCSSGTDNTAADGTDTDSDGLCDAGDVDDDNDGVNDGLDSAPLNPNVCRDADGDTCDDCSSGTDNTAADGIDFDSDGLCDLGDPDDDNDGVNDGLDSAPLDPNVCRDADGDTCDDCSSGTDNTAADGTDTDSDGACDAGDDDDDNDGVDDGDDSAPLNPLVCRDLDGDTCDDCSNVSTPSTVVESSFDGGADGFAYADDTFLGTSQPNYANGFYASGSGFTGGGLRVDIGGMDGALVTDMSGGWSRSFTLPSSVSVSLSFRYNMTQGNGYESDEFTQVLLSIDGTLVGQAPNSYVAELIGDGNGGPPISTGWQQFTVNLGILPAGQHTIVIGGYNNKKSQPAEIVAILIDDVLVTSEALADPDNDGTDTDSDGLCDAGDGDDDNDGVSDGLDNAPLDAFACRDEDLDSCDDCSSGTDAPNNDGLDTDSDGLCDAGDGDDDNDGVSDGLDDEPTNPNACRDADLDTCDDCSSGSDNPANDGTDTDSDGLCDAGDDDDDNDGVNDGQDTEPLNPNVCRDADGDGCEDCSSGTDAPNNDGLDTDSDGLCDSGDPDDDNDGVDDGLDSEPLNPNVCRDADGDGCEDCLSGTDNQAADGPDFDTDGLCDGGDPDDDNDGVNDGSDANPFNPNVCRDADGDTCDDCTNGSDNTANDGLDTDSDGLCDAGDPDDDNDGVADGQDSAPLNPNVCRDADGDSCDDCTNGSDDTANDGLDTDSDGACDLTDPDDDNDGVEDGLDSDPLDGTVCRDVDADSCDDCTNGSDDTDNDGLDSEGDGLCDAGDPDDDNDGVDDGLDSAPLNPNVCRDADSDSCDDCSGGSDDPNSDGLDTDGDGACDVGDPDDDNDGVADGADNAPLNSNACRDADVDTCDDCTNGSDDTANDGLDSEGDGLCDAGDPDDDNDGVDDGLDSAPLDANTCRDVDLDTCDDCSSGSDNPANDGIDSDSDGLCDAGDPDDDNDGVNDGSDNAPLDPNVCRDADGDSCDDCTNGSDDTANDGLDTDSDGACDLTDPDDDNDGVEDGLDSDPVDGTVCRDVDADSCDDCSSGTDNPDDDGTDTDSDGLCDAGDPDDDGDGVDDGSDNAPLDPNACRDADVDTCDDCTNGSDAPNDDGLDSDADGLCDAGDPDDDNDGVNDESDSAPLNPNVCRDTDLDSCDDCVNGSDDPANDGLDSEEDGLCDAGDPDDDNDGVEDGLDSAPLDPNECRDADVDTCDDCINGSDNVLNDGLDTDSDGLCDAGDPDDDGDGVNDGADSAPLDPNLCRDADGDSCDDCTNGSDDPADDGLDTDSDGMCNATDPDDDGDGVEDGLDSAPLDPNVCRDLDIDGCDDCTNGSADPLNDGPDPDLDGICSVTDPDDDNDGILDAGDCASDYSGVSELPGLIGNTLTVERSGGTDAVLHWSRGIQGHTSNLYRGTILPGLAWSYATSCFESENPTVDSIGVDSDVPPPGFAYYYMVGSRNICGDSPIHVDSDGVDILAMGSCASGAADTDLDGAIDLVDNCPETSNVGLTDVDQDFVGDLCDNCPTDPNPDQADSDDDTIGDVCDPGAAPGAKGFPSFGG